MQALMICCNRDAAAARAKEAQSWALDIAFRAALAEKELLRRQLETEGSRLGHVKTARTGSLGISLYTARCIDAACFRQHKE